MIHHYVLAISVVMTAMTLALNGVTDGRQAERLADLKTRAEKLDTELVKLDKDIKAIGERTIYAIAIKSTVSGYTSRPEETDDTPCIGAWGHNLCEIKQKGTNICASNDFPPGTKMEIKDLGICFVLDRMNSRYTGKQRIDWYFGNDLKAAKEFGVKKLDVVIGTAL
jgi:3D (Asp-Asp-Asp) domain-containing protein